MARSERQDAGTRGGTGTLTRSGPRPRPRQGGAGGTEADAVPGAPEPRRGRPRPVPPQPTGPVPPAAGGQRPTPGARPADRREQRVPSQRSAAGRPVAERRAAAGRRAGGRRGDAAQAVAAPPRPGLRRWLGVPRQAPPAEQGTQPQRVRATGPQPVAAPERQPRGPQALSRAAEPGKANPLTGSHRMPFMLLLCGLLGGALVCALVISTTLAEGSFQISNLQASTNTLAKQQQALEEEVAQAQSPEQIAQRAGQLGMRRVSELRFIDLTTGKVTTDGPTWSGGLNAPGYAP